MRQVLFVDRTRNGATSPMAHCRTGLIEVSTASVYIPRPRYRPMLDDLKVTAKRATIAHGEAAKAAFNLAPAVCPVFCDRQDRPNANPDIFDKPTWL